MSGGSLNYAFTRVDDVAYELERMSDLPLHRAFAYHLRLVAKALHDIEWVFSCDYSGGDEEEAIMAVIAPQDILAAAIMQAAKAAQDLEAALLKVQKSQQPSPACAEE